MLDNLLFVVFPYVAVALAMGSACINGLRRRWVSQANYLDGTVFFKEK